MEIKINPAYCFKCFACGFAMCVPGLSGGSMAVLLGIYKELLEIASSFVSKPRKYLKPLAFTGVFCVLGALAFSFFPGRYAANHEDILLIFAAVVVAASLPFYIKNSQIIKRKFGAKGGLLILLGAASIVLIELAITSATGEAGAGFGVFSYFLAGFILTVSLVLPGISFPYMLGFIGVYGKVITAVNEFDLSILFPLGAGLALGVVTLSKYLLLVMEKLSYETDCFLLGFTAASALVIFI
ncbi:MAG: DUF368 domain-containing protein [Eubacteriales bacterium]